MLLNVLLFVGLIYLIIQIIKDVKNFFKMIIRTLKVKE